MRIGIALALIAVAAPLDAQVSGTLRGRVTAEAGAPVAGASVEIVGYRLRTITNDAGEFVLAAIPPGERTVRIEHIGFRPLLLENTVITPGRPTRIQATLSLLPVEVAGVTVEATRVRLIEPDVSASRTIVLAREVQALPIDRVEEVLELTPGVSGGHFRGGRTGQETYVIDGLEMKNQLEASAHGLLLELPPGALEEIEVTTGGVAASHGSALSGVVSFVTRRGNAEHWEASADVRTDAWLPASEYTGFNRLSLSAGGPLHALGSGTTLRVDLLADGMQDADPRARGLTCLRPGDADSALAPVISELDTRAPGLRCPYTHNRLPNQAGDRMIAFLRLDRPLIANANLSVSVLSNRLQRGLYTPEFRYNPSFQLGQRSTGTLARAGLEWTWPGPTVHHLTLRAAVVRLDRYLGAIDAAAMRERGGAAGFSFSSLPFLGEDFVRGPIDRQLESPASIPGYSAPGGSAGSPFGSAGEGIFFTEGTLDIANWTRSDLLALDASLERIAAAGSIVRVGGNARLYRTETYQRVLGHLAGSAPSYARFYPATLSAFVDARIAGDDELNLTAGVRFEAFRSGVRFQRDRADFLAPVLDAAWQFALMPRFGLALPIPGSQGRTALRLSYGLVAQPPDFRYFLDTTIGDSLRTDLQRQGNPELSFEKGRAYEVGVSQLMGEHIGVAVTAFRKDLRALASAGLQIGTTGNSQYSTSDFGTVRGLEVSLHATWPRLAVRAGWTLQKATGIASGTDADSVLRGEPIELPLAFDQRHAIDAAVLFGAAAGQAGAVWSAALTTSTRSGFPRDRRAAAGDTTLAGEGARMPWTSTIDLRISRSLGAVPGCIRCVWRIVADGRNILGRANVLGLRRETGRVAPSLDAVQALAGSVAPPADAIPAESPLYVRALDTDGDGLIRRDEFERGRLAAVLDRFDPSLFYGEARLLRLGVMVSF
ncbi:MAG: TonB-dependent receptor [Gemmatimonadetes bacterium]|nr:TonB-dependent receptor [Gemmatimonadota bacterium]